MMQWGWAALLLLLAGGAAWADPMGEAREIGQGSVSAVHAGLRIGEEWTAPAVAALPGGATPQATAAGAGAAGMAMAEQCASNPGAGVECEGINAAAASVQQDAAYQSAMDGYADVARLQSGELTPDSGIDGAYSDCTTTTVTKGQKFYDEQYCHNYYLRVLDQPCTKTLDVNVLCESRVVPKISAATSWNWCGGCAYNRDGQWSNYRNQVTALLGALGNQTQFLGSFTTGDYWGVVGTGGLPMVFKVNGRTYGTGTSLWYYHIPRTCDSDGSVVYCGTDYGICVNNSPTFLRTGCTGAINDSMVDLNGQGDCPNPTWRPPSEDYPGHYYCPGSTNISCPSGSAPQVIDGNTACIGTLSCYEEDSWQNSCIDYETRVPPGQLPPDGVNPDGETIPYPVATGSGPQFKCERTDSVCTQGAETRIIDGYEVTRSCWQYANTFSCLNQDPKSDCDQPRSGDCTEIGTTCVDQDGDLCTAEEKRFKCMVEDTTREETVTDCGSQVFQENASGVTWDTSYAADDDLAAVVAYMEAGREAGGYLDPDTLEIFKGYRSRCRKKLFGLVNCCNKGGSDGSMFSNSAIAAASVGGQALVSTYTYDALFASAAPDWVINGFSAVFGSGSSSALAGMLAGDVTVEGFLSSLIPGPWSIALMALQFSGLMSCEDSDIETALRKDAKLCVDLGRYCSKKLPIVGCLERTYSYCCFNSVLAKLVNTQGKAQLGKSMGTAKHPDCGGFTPEELQTLDLAAMDLTEFMDQIKPPASLNPPTPSCYFNGDSSCTVAH